MDIRDVKSKSRRTGKGWGWQEINDERGTETMRDHLTSPLFKLFSLPTDSSDIVQLVKSLSLISLWMTSCAGISVVLPPITFIYVFSLESTEIQLLSIHHRKMRIRQGPTSHLEACWPCPNQVRKAKHTVYIMSLAKHHSWRYEHMIEIGLNWKSQVKRKWPSNNKLINIRLRHKATSCKRSSSRNHKNSSSGSGHHPKSLLAVPICAIHNLIWSVSDWATYKLISPHCS